MTATPTAAGLCDTCAHAERVRSARGSTFILCARSRADARYPRYPRLPVVRCPGFEQRPPDDKGRAQEPP